MNVDMEKDYFERLANAYNLIPAKGARVPLYNSIYHFSERDTLALIAKRMIQFEQGRPSATLYPLKEELIVEIVLLCSNNDKNKAIYDVTKRIEELAMEAIRADFDKDIESEKDEKRLGIKKRYRAYIEDNHQKFESRRTPANGFMCRIIGSPADYLPAWYREAYDAPRTFNNTYVPNFTATQD